MGVLRTIFRAFLGPALVYFILMAHVVYQVAFKEAEPLEVPQWPANTKPEDREAIISARKPILREYMDFLAGKNAEFFKQHGTKDVDWEDSIQRITGFNEVDGFARLATRWIKDTEVEIFSEHHAPHEIVMDWNLKVSNRNSHAKRSFQKVGVTLLLIMRSLHLIHQRFYFVSDYPFFPPKPSDVG